MQRGEANRAESLLANLEVGLHPLPVPPRGLSRGTALLAGRCAELGTWALVHVHGVPRSACPPSALLGEGGL